MRQNIPLEMDKLDYFSTKNLFDRENEPNQKIERMKKILYIGIETELTQRQKDCLTMRFLESKKVKEIADILCIRPTTVYKHVKYSPPIEAGASFNPPNLTEDFILRASVSEAMGFL